MRKIFLVLICFLGFLGCKQQEENSEMLHRTFSNNMWERFDYVKEEISIKETTTFNLNMKISFTDDYPYEDFSMVFTVFTNEGEPYRSKGYKFRLKDAEGHWNSERIDGCYTFDMPINNALQITEAGTYYFQIENRMAKTPLMGVKELTLINNNK